MSGVTIHIGPPKTATTSLQNSVIPQLGLPFENRNRLRFACFRGLVRHEAGSAEGFGVRRETGTSPASNGVAFYGNGPKSMSPLCQTSVILWNLRQIPALAKRGTGHP